MARPARPWWVAVLTACCLLACRSQAASESLVCSRGSNILRSAAQNGTIRVDGDATVGYSANCTFAIGSGPRPGYELWLFDVMADMDLQNSVFIYGENLDASPRTFLPDAPSG